MSADLEAKDQEKAALSKKYMEESFALVNQQRHGLFSVPGSLAIGENTYAPRKVPKRDDDGRVSTQPPNFLTTKIKKGHTDNILFSKPSYTSVEDPYNDKKLQMREAKKDGYKAVSDLPFKPAKTVPNPVKATFEYMEQDKNIKKNFKGPDGVITGPK